MDGYPDVDMEEVFEDDDDQQFSDGMYKDMDDDADDNDDLHNSSALSIPADKAENNRPRSPSPVVKKIVDWDTDLEPFPGFNEEEEKPLLDKVEYDSALLFEIVTEIEKDEIIKAICSITAANKGGPVNVPVKLLAVNGGAVPSIKVIRAPGQEKTIQEILETLQKPFEAGWKRELVYKCVSDSKSDLVQYISPDGTEIKSMEELVDYLENIYGVSESAGGLAEKNFTFYKSPLTALGENCGELVYVNDPKGGKTLVNLRKRKPISRRKVLPPKRFSGRENVLPVKRVRAAVPQSQENERIIAPNQRPLPKLPVGQPGANFRKVMNHDSQQIRDGRAQLEGVGRIRRRGPRRPGFQGNNNNMSMAGMQEEDQDGMFQISALHQANPMLVSGLEEQRDQYRRDQEMYESQFSASADTNTDKPHGDGPDGEVLPCSIRCPGMTGDVPTLQCKRCLCLYHAECLGVSPNLNCVSFICPNCEAKGEADTSESLESPSTQSGIHSNPVLPPRRRRQPPPRLSADFVSDVRAALRAGHKILSEELQEFQPIGRGGMSVRRMDIRPPPIPPLPRFSQFDPSGPTRGRGNASMRGRWIGPAKYPRVPFPNLSSGGKSLTITPIVKFPRGRAPQVPNLHQMLSNSNMRGRPMPSRGNFNMRGMPGRGSPFGRVGNIIRPALPLPDFARPGRSTPNKDGLRLVEGLTQAYDQLDKQFHSAPFRRFPQSVIALGLKKFIAIRRGHPENNRSPARTYNSVSIEPIFADNGELEEEDKETNNAPSGFATEEFVLKKIFPYLSVPDLLSASQVNTTWKKVASNNELWKTLRMKNARVFDFESFVQFLNKRETEVIDLRKMMGESNTNWKMLIESLGKIPSLQNIVLGPRSSTAEHLELLREYCPNIRVTTQ